VRDSEQRVYLVLDDERLPLDAPRDCRRRHPDRESSTEEEALRMEEEDRG